MGEARGAEWPHVAPPARAMLSDFCSIRLYLRAPSTAGTFEQPECEPLHAAHAKHGLAWCASQVSYARKKNITWTCIDTLGARKAKCLNISVGTKEQYRTVYELQGGSDIRDAGLAAKEALCALYRPEP